METGSVPPEAVAAHLERVLGSATFRGAERSRSLLRFIVQEGLQGRAERLKEYTLGSEALGRGEQFDPRTDPIARVEASRLRSRLEMYYATEGVSDTVRISLPKGGYTPVFDVRPAATPIEQPFVEPLPVPPTVPTLRSQTMAFKLALAGMAVVVAVPIVIAGWLFTRPVPRPPPAPEMRLEITTPATTDPVSLAIAPDGRSLVFVGSTDGLSRLWMRRLDSDTPRQLIGTEHASLPFWAPDGRSIGFFADGKIKRIDLESGLVRPISTAAVPAGAAWNSDGVILHPLVPDSPLFRTSVSGSPLVPATQLTPGQTGHRGPAFLPDGRHFLFYAMGSTTVRGIYVGELGTTVVRRLLDADTPAVFAPPSHVLYLQHSTLFAHRLDPETITLFGEPMALAEGIASEAGAGLPAIAASATGTIVYRAGSAGGQRQFIWFDRAGKEFSRIGTPAAHGPSYGSISPDRRRLAMQRTVDGNTDIWLLDLERGPAIRFTSDPQADIAPAWSPRGDRIAYASQLDGVFELFEKALDGTPARLLLRTPQAKQVTDWSRDGRFLLFRAITLAPRADMDIWAMALDGDRAPFAVVRTPFEERDAQFSPDGRWIAYQSNESGQPEVYVQPFLALGERVRISANGGVQARWRADGQELFYLTLEGQLVAVPMALRPDGRTLRPGAAVPLFPAKVGAVQGITLHSYLVAPEGQQFLLDTVVEQTPAPISLILNAKGW
jgi:Tol biopolymer transport system component